MSGATTAAPVGRRRAMTMSPARHRRQSAKAAQAQHRGPLSLLDGNGNSDSELENAAALDVQATCTNVASHYRNLDLLNLGAHPLQPRPATGRRRSTSCSPAPRSQPAPKLPAPRTISHPKPPPPKARLNPSKLLAFALGIVLVLAFSGFSPLARRTPGRAAVAGAEEPEPPPPPPPLDAEEEEEEEGLPLLPAAAAPKGPLRAAAKLLRAPQIKFLALSATALARPPPPPLFSRLRDAFALPMPDDDLDDDEF